jgi:hypothetical protein
MEAVIFDGLGQIPEHAVELKAAANFLVANYGRQKIISMPRAVPKIAIFEEAARTLDIPGGTKMIQEYYRQMRKFGCNILAVIQQYDIIKESAVRGAMIGNSKMLLKLNSRLSVKPLNPLVDVAQITYLWIRPLFRNEWQKESIRFSD